MNNNNAAPGIWYYGLAVLTIFIGFAAFAGSIYSTLISLAALFGSIAIAALITFVTYDRRKKSFLKMKRR